MTEGSMASELQAQLDKQKYGEDEDPQRVCAIGAVYGTWSNAGSFTPDDTETAWDADSLTEALGSDACAAKIWLLALDGEDTPLPDENCLLKDTRHPRGRAGAKNCLCWIKTTWRRRNPQNLNKI